MWFTRAVDAAPKSIPVAKTVALPSIGSASRRPVPDFAAVPDRSCAGSALQSAASVSVCMGRTATGRTVVAVPTIAGLAKEGLVEIVWKERR